MIRSIALCVLTACLMVSTACNQVDARIAADKGYRSYLAKQFDESIQHYEDARAAAPKNNDVLLNLGYAYLGAAREGSSKEKSRAYYDKAIQVLTKLLEQKPKDMELSSVLLDAWTQADRLDDAARFFDARTQKDPKDMEALRLLGMIELRRGNYQAALDVYEKRKQLKPEDAQVYAAMATLCWEWLRSGGPSDAATAIEIASKGLNAALEANKRDPRHPSALVYAGLLLRERAQRQSDKKEAQKDLISAQELLKKIKERRQPTDSTDNKQVSMLTPKLHS